ncbi:MAG: DUF1761 domain-containing protein [FCB group bacterium]|nr:DUF1761 domain-containing protein [FCB group bacterium]
MESVIINYWAVLVATVVYYVLGGLWYSPLLFGKSWMKLVNLTEEDCKKGAGMAYVVSFIASFLMAYILAYIIHFAHAITAFRGAETGFWCWLGFVATVTTANMMYSKKPFKLHLIDILYPLVGLLIMGAILGGWK